jgi:hypothetical protein
LASICGLAHASGSLFSLQFVGRIDNLEGPTNIHFDWSAVELQVSFSLTAPASSISLSLTDEGNLFNVFVDGATTPNIVQTQPNGGNAASYVLASGLSAGVTHTLRITKRTEPLVGITICK